MTWSPLSIIVRRAREASPGAARHRRRSCPAGGARRITLPARAHGTERSLDTYRGVARKADSRE